MLTFGFSNSTKQSQCRYKPHIRKTCEEIVKTSGKDIAHILVDKNKEVDTDIMNCTLLYIHG